MSTVSLNAWSAKNTETALGYAAAVIVAIITAVMLTTCVWIAYRPDYQNSKANLLREQNMAQRDARAWAGTNVITPNTTSVVTGNVFCHAVTTSTGVTDQHCH